MHMKRKRAIIPQHVIAQNMNISQQKYNKVFNILKQHVFQKNFPAPYPLSSYSLHTCRQFCFITQYKLQYSVSMF